MARFCTLFSGSSGNSAYIGGAGSGLLIDAGKNCKQLLLALQARELSAEDIDGILLTHEHSDHIGALRVLLKKYSIPVYASEEVLAYLSWNNILPPAHPVTAVTAGVPFEVGALLVEAFDTPHDSLHSLGFQVSTPDGRRLGVATDVGYISEAVHGMLSGCDLVLLESNYDKSMLSACDYTYSLKRRIAAPNGHLSNDDCADELARLVRLGSTRFVLGHLSENSNLPELAYRTASCAFAMERMREGSDYLLTVAPRHSPSELMIL